MIALSDAEGIAPLSPKEKEKMEARRLAKQLQATCPIEECPAISNIEARYKELIELRCLLAKVDWRVAQLEQENAELRAALGRDGYA